MTNSNLRTLHISAMVKSLAQKEQFHRGNLRKKVLLKTTRKRYKQPLLRKQESQQCEDNDLKNEKVVKEYGFKLASISLPSIVCWILIMLGGFLCTFGYSRL